MQEAREKLESEMEDAYHEHQANLLRQGKFSGIFRFNKAMRFVLSNFAIDMSLTWLRVHKGSTTISNAGFMFPLRSAEAAGGTTAYGGAAQSGDAKEEGNAAKVCMFNRSLGCGRRQIVVIQASFYKPYVFYYIPHLCYVHFSSPALIFRVTCSAIVMVELILDLKWSHFNCHF